MLSEVKAYGKVRRFRFAHIPPGLCVLGIKESDFEIMAKKETPTYVENPSL
jgi:hypothetical protein